MIRRDEGVAIGRKEPPRRNGWGLYQWTEFGRALAELAAQVERLQREDPDGYRAHPATKRLAAIYRLVSAVIPADPSAPEFRQGNTRGPENRHWFSAGFYEKYRLFFRFRTDARAIVYAWVNSDETLRARGSRSDAYAVFERMLRAGAPPGDWEQLMKESEGLRLPED